MITEDDIDGVDGDKVREDTDLSPKGWVLMAHQGENMWSSLRYWYNPLLQRVVYLERTGEEEWMMGWEHCHHDPHLHCVSSDNRQHNIREIPQAKTETQALQLMKTHMVKNQIMKNDSDMSSVTIDHDDNHLIYFAPPMIIQRMEEYFDDPLQDMADVFGVYYHR